MINADYSNNTSFPCRPGCGACCIAMSISSPIPGMPSGKAAGEKCIHLSEDNLCRLFDSPDRPAICGAFRAGPEMCGTTREDALAYIEKLERLTRPGGADCFFFPAPEKKE